MKIHDNSIYKDAEFYRLCRLWAPQEVLKAFGIRGVRRFKNILKSRNEQRDEYKVFDIAWTEALSNHILKHAVWHECVRTYQSAKTYLDRCEVRWVVNPKTNDIYDRIKDQYWRRDSDEIDIEPIPENALTQYLSEEKVNAMAAEKDYKDAHPIYESRPTYNANWNEESYDPEWERRWLNED